MTHVVKLDSLAGYKEKGNLHFILKIFFFAYLSENRAFSQNFYNLFWKYSILPNEILLKYLFLKLWNKQGRPSLSKGVSILR